MLKKVRVEEAIGLAIGHDITKVIPGKFKGPAFRRGHIIRQEDIPELLRIGKKHVYIIEEEEGWVHEEEAALRIAKAVSSPDMQLTSPKEGRVNIKSNTHGLLKVNKTLLNEINSIKDIVLATLHDNTVCQPGTVVAGTKINPLYIPEAKLNMVEELCQKKGKVLKLIPFKAKKVGIIVTGNEVFEGRVKDKFSETIQKKVEALGSVVNHMTIVPDNEELIGQAINNMRAKGSEVIVVAGGLSVDPDDVTVEGVAKSGAEIISYGAPVMPGAMFLYAELGDIPILGAPGAVIFNQTTIIDLILPRVLAGERISREDIVALGHGGLCLDCDGCTFPICPFGK
jgi:molybdenum cofactor synthesis domain-containing protein